MPLPHCDRINSAAMVRRLMGVKSPKRREQIKARAKSRTR
jgi:hypothetical protein